jgi:hypothetical protein
MPVEMCIERKEKRKEKRKDEIYGCDTGAMKKMGDKMTRMQGETDEEVHIK